MVTWKELAASYRPHHKTSLEDIRSLWPELLELARDNDKAASFVGMDNTLATLIAFLGPSRALADVGCIRPALRAVLARMDPTPKKTDRHYTTTVLSFVNAHRCGGLRKTTARADAERERRWITALAKKPETQFPPDFARGRAALIAVAVGLPDLGVQVGNADRRRNVERQLADLAVELAEERAKAKDGAAPWESFLQRRFPGNPLFQWSDLLWAARAVHVTVRGGRIADVGTWLQREVARTTLAARVDGGGPLRSGRVILLSRTLDDTARHIARRSQSPMLEETELRSYLTDLAQASMSRLPSDEFEIIFERLGDIATVAHGPAVSWLEVIGAGASSDSKADRYRPFKPFGLSLDDLTTVDLALTDVVGANFRAYELLDRRPAIWAGFLLEGSQGRFRLEFWRCD